MTVAAPLGIATVGVYGATVERYLSALSRAEVSLVLDVRQRRGVRGPQYAWANSKRLQSALSEADIGYRHVPELAPTTELRHLQYAVDDAEGVGKRNRARLAPEYSRRYVADILDRVDLAGLVGTLPQAGLAALMCVEREPEACHRSLIAARLASDYGFGVIDLLP